MSYHVLARKWRSKNFSDLVGQTHVVKALNYALSEQKIHHAYLFTGTRGVGKTSIARIFSKSLNCETNGVSPNPCDECETCVEITNGRFVDLIEVDAASRTGVDETRELIDSVAYLPTKGRYKVYLIDEVHMFSKSSFNALLKTLEEPPEYVKFILATTDPEKLPITILSRCLQFNLKALTPKQIYQHLVNICDAESIQYESEALRLLANAGDGSMRDALSITDQAIAYGQGALCVEAVSEILGTIHPNDIEAIIFAIATNNPTQLSEALHRLDNYDVDARSFLIEVMQRLQHMAWAKEGIVEDALSPTLMSTVNDIPKPLLHLWYDIAEKALGSLKLAGNPRRAVEMTLLRMIAFIPDDWIVRHRTPLDISVDTTPVTEPSEKEDVHPQGFAQEVTAVPVESHESFDDAEKFFSSDTVSTDHNVHEQELGYNADSELTENSENESSDSWNLIAEDNNHASPSMDDVKSMMQTARTIEPPPLSEPENNTAQELHESDNLAPWEETADSISDEVTQNNEKEVESESLAVLQQQPIAEDSPINDESTMQENNTDGERRDAEDIVQEIAQLEYEEQTQEKPHLQDNIKAFDWNENLPQLGLSEYTHHFASLGIMSVDLKDGYVQATLTIPPKNDIMVNDESVQEIEQALENHFSSPTNVVIELANLTEHTPQELESQNKEKQQLDFFETFEQDSITQAIMNEFEGDILKATVKPKDNKKTKE